MVAFRIMIFCCPVLRGSQQPLVYPNLCVSKRSSSCVFTYSVHQSESRFYSSHSCVDTPKIVHSCGQYNSLAQSRLPVSWFAKSIWLVWLSSLMIFQAVVCLWVVSTGRCAPGRYVPRFMLFQAFVCLWVVSMGRCALGRYVPSCNRLYGLPCSTIQTVGASLTEMAAKLS